VNTLRLRAPAGRGVAPLTRGVRPPNRVLLFAELSTSAKRVIVRAFVSAAHTSSNAVSNPHRLDACNRRTLLGLLEVGY
jgi:hypothetical protein